MKRFLGTPISPFERRTNIIKGCIRASIEYLQSGHLPQALTKTRQVLTRHINDTVAATKKNTNLMILAIRQKNHRNFIMNEHEILKAWNQYIEGMWDYTQQIQDNLFVKAKERAELLLRNNGIKLEWATSKTLNKLQWRHYTQQHLNEDLRTQIQSLFESQLSQGDENILICSDPRHLLVKYNLSPELMQEITKWKQERDRQKLMDTRQDLSHYMPPTKQARVIQHAGKSPSFPDMSKYFKH